MDSRPAAPRETRRQPSARSAKREDPSPRPGRARPGPAKISASVTRSTRSAEYGTPRWRVVGTSRPLDSGSFGLNSGRSLPDEGRRPHARLHEELVEAAAKAGHLRRQAAEEVRREVQHVVSGEPWKSARYDGGCQTPPHLPRNRSPGSGVFSETPLLEASESAQRWCEAASRSTSRSTAVSSRPCSARSAPGRRAAPEDWPPGRQKLDSKRRAPELPTRWFDAACPTNRLRRGSTCWARQPVHPLHCTIHAGPTNSLTPSAMGLAC